MNDDLTAKVANAIRRMHSTYHGERMVMKAHGRLEWVLKRPIPVVDAEEALCILIEQGWTWEEITFINS